MIPTIILVIIGVAFAWIGYMIPDNTVLTVGLVVLLAAAVVGIIHVAGYYRRPPPR